ncbi:hypothetical protein ACJRO7_026998 [Eucalyptus globulus]|uniref:Uncharacterized protein n=1 Tax=Eucalyptus globulus TaxID=34317 RepID=A0ABD3K2E4_EUCGL
MSSSACGRIVVGLRFSHRIAGMHTMSSFLSMWATACRTSINKVIHPCFDISSIFPPSDLTKLELPFMFDSQSISKLKAAAKRGGFDSGREPSRVELVTALSSIALLDIAKLKNTQSKPLLIAHTVNLRGRTDLLWHENSCGNLYMVVHWKSAVEFNGMVNVICDMISDAKTKYATIIDKEKLCSTMVNSQIEFIKSVSIDEEFVIVFSGRCRYRPYENDFGWGKPVFVSNKSVNFRLIVLIDDEERGGVNAWITIKKKRKRDGSS